MPQSTEGGPREGHKSEEMRRLAAKNEAVIERQKDRHSIYSASTFSRSEHHIRPGALHLRQPWHRLKASFVALG